MKNFWIGIGLLISLSISTFATTHYVWQNSPTPTSPYTNWITAATNIQDAVDAAIAGDEVVVTNGVYATGSRTVVGRSTANRIVVEKALTLRSVNGPEFTAIEGRQVPGTTNGIGAIRCAYLNSESVLSGFTLTNGATDTSDEWALARSGGGAWCRGNTLVSNCVFANNSAFNGGAAYSGTFDSCTFFGNTADDWGGGVCDGTLNRCTLIGNTAPYGGGAAYSTLKNCLLISNLAVYGGGAYYGNFSNCTLTGNSAFSGGGAYQGNLRNSTITCNSASYAGGGAAQSKVYNCTVTGNSAKQNGGAAGCKLYNCIVYFNTATVQANYDDICTWTNCCTTPLPSDGIRNFDADPQLASMSHLSANSPCIGKGDFSYATATDIDGEPWENPPSIGCDEYIAGSVTGTLGVKLVASCTNVASAFTVDFQALIAGKTTASRWEFGDGTMVSNRPYTSHSWGIAGDYPVVLRAYNEDHPAGVGTTVMVHVVTPPVHYVSLSSATPTAPFSSWETAASNIQDAIDAAILPGAVILVSNGVYNTGGRMMNDSTTNRVALYKPVVVQSFNGPQVTIIQGFQNGITNGNSIRGVYITNRASLCAFTVTRGYAEEGGGIWCESSDASVSDCLLSSNSAAYGGGVYSGSLNNCTLIRNWASYGGGAYGTTLSNCSLLTNSTASSAAASYSTLLDCTITGNSGNYAGGASHSILKQCTLTGNAATNSGGGVSYSEVDRCTIANNSAEYGGGAYRSTLRDCILTSNRARSPDAGGGGAYISNLRHCILSNNWASGTYGQGGGAYGGTMDNCVLIANSAKSGGGADGGSLNNCTLTGNSAKDGGGVYGGILTNCIVYNNNAPTHPNNSGGLFYHCCTLPLPTGTGNITNLPEFMDTIGSNLRLQSNSPCINAGENADAPAGADLDGNPRVVGGTVDIGAYEHQSPSLLPFYTWLQSYGLSTHCSATYADSDGDRLNNWQEWLCLTDPTNKLSVLRLLSPSQSSDDVTVTWGSVLGVQYHILRSTKLSAWRSFTLIASNIIGQGATTSYKDTNAANMSTLFYRVGVGEYIAPTNPPSPTITCVYNQITRTVQINWSGTEFRLQSQTNTIDGLTTDWYDYPGGTNSPVAVPISAQNRSVFYRLIWP